MTAVDVMAKHGWADRLITLLAAHVSLGTTAVFNPEAGTTDTMPEEAGRTGTGAQRARQYVLHSDSSLTPEILAGPGWCRAAVLR
jgi:hypothetical protein